MSVTKPRICKLTEGWLEIDKHYPLELCNRCPAVTGSVRPWSSLSRTRSSLSYWRPDGLTGVRARLSEVQPASIYIDCSIEYTSPKKGDAYRRGYGGCMVISSSLNTAKRQNLF